MSEKEIWRPGNMLYPLPAVLVTARNAKGEDNLCTVAWTGTVCSDPVMLSISLRPSRLTCEYIRETGVFVVNLTTKRLAHAADFCGVRSGRDLDKFAHEHLTKAEAEKISCSMLEESPVCLECRVAEEKPLGSHTMFLAEVLAVHVDRQYMDDKGRFDLMKAEPIVYSHGEYAVLGEKIGRFGFSVRKPSARTRTGKKERRDFPKKQGGKI